MARFDEPEVADSFTGTITAHDLAVVVQVLTGQRIEIDDTSSIETGRAHVRWAAHT